MQIVVSGANISVGAESVEPTALQVLVAGQWVPGLILVNGNIERAPNIDESDWLAGYWRHDEGFGILFDAGTTVEFL